ncbi:MAG: MBL fold metallo-hydrolase [Muribaculaceae bacterium]|nr:MBL fold metallo-hydrolase [Muribaculaceae bacterium]
MTEVTYLWHDGFSVHKSGCTLVFDYWRAGGNAGAFHIKGPLYVFISHFHKDHYDPAVVEWASRREGVRYIVSRDVWLRMRHIMSPTSIYNGPRVHPGQVICLTPGQSFADEHIRVSAFPSTDVGNSYVVQIGGDTIFHAGDLNAWIWKDESTEQEIEKSLSDFNGCLDKIQEAGFSKFDYAFFPVDSRIGSDYFMGARIFVRRFKVSRFFPMHFALGDEAERNIRRADAIRFDNYRNPDFGEYFALTDPGQSVRFD